MTARAWWLLAALGGVVVYALTRPRRCTVVECQGCRECL